MRAIYIGDVVQSYRRDNNNAEKRIP